MIEEELDPKAKRPDPKKKAVDSKPPAFTEEQEAMFGPRKCIIEYKKEVELTPQQISFDLTFVFQGPDYVDPNPPPVEVDAKPVKGKARKPTDAPIEPEIRMITPPPIPLSNESGRAFEFEIGRIESCLKPEHTEEELNELKERGEEVPEGWYEMRWVRYPLLQPEYPTTAEDIANVRSSVDTNAMSVASGKKKPVPVVKGKGGKPLEEEVLSQPDPVYKLPDLPEIEEKTILIESIEGKISLENIVLRPWSNFKPGYYEIVGRDVTVGLRPSHKMKTLKVLVKLVDLDEEAFLAAVQAPPVKGGKRK